MRRVLLLVLLLLVALTLLFAPATSDTTRINPLEFLVNSLVGMVLLVFDLARGLLEWGDKAVLIGAAVAAGAFLGVRLALTRHQV